MAHDYYPRAIGHMAEVWAKCECPICSTEMEHSSDDYDADDERQELHLDTYACNHCNLLITYVSPAQYGAYHEVPESDRRYFIERQIP